MVCLLLSLETWPWRLNELFLLLLLLSPHYLRILFLPVTNLFLYFEVESINSRLFSTVHSKNGVAEAFDCISAIGIGIGNR